MALPAVPQLLNGSTVNHGSVTVSRLRMDKSKIHAPQ